MEKTLISLFAMCAVMAVGTARADLVNHFTFDDPDHLLAASVGNDGVAYIGGGNGAYKNKCEVDASNGGLGQLSAASLSGIASAIRNGDALKIPSTGIMAFDQLAGSDAAHSWCMVMRFQPPVKSNSYYCLYSLCQSNDTDGYLFIQKNGSGFGGTTGGWSGYPSISAGDGIFGAWNTMVVCCDVENSKLRLFVNGELLHDRTGIGNNSLAGKPKVLIGADNDGEDALFYVDDVKFYNEAYPDEYFVSAGTMRTGETSETYAEATVSSSVKPVRTQNGDRTEFVFRADGSVAFSSATFAIVTFYDAKGDAFNTEVWGVVGSGYERSFQIGDAEKAVVTLNPRTLDDPYALLKVDECGAGYVKYSWQVANVGTGALSADVFASVVPQGEEADFVKIAETSSISSDWIPGQNAVLVPETTYECSLKVVNDAGKEMVTDAVVFTTPSAPVTSAPVFTSALVDVVPGSCSAAIEFEYDVAYAGSGKATTTVKVQYGIREDDLDQEVIVASDWIGKGTYSLSGLYVGRFYYVRFVVDNGTETTMSPVQTVSTGRRWTLGAEAGTLTDGSWIVKFTKDDFGAITLTQVVTPAADSSVFDISNPYVRGDDGKNWYFEKLGQLFGNRDGSGNLDIEEVYLPSTLKYIGDYAFKNCFNLRTVYPFLPDSVEAMGTQAFWGCVSLSGDLRIGCGGRPFAFNGSNQFDADNEHVVTGSVTSVTFGPEVTAVPASFCWSQQSLTNVTFLGTKVGAIEAKAFYNCSNLRTIEPFFPSSITNFGNICFEKCLKISGEMTIGGAKDPARVVSAAFDASRSDPLRPVTSITFKKNVESVGTYAFFGMGTQEVVFECGPNIVFGIEGSFGFHQPEYSKYYVPADNADWQAVYENPDYVTPLASVAEEDKAHLPAGKLPYGLAKEALFGVKEWLYFSAPGSGFLIIVR